jgi:hypothetical protein
MSLPAADLILLRDGLVKVCAKRVKTVQMGMERVECKTDAEMASAIADLEVRIRRASSPSTGLVRLSTSKGM